ncbi:uncharacterized protein LOC118016226 isoform X1 [Mirounga leonina]|uniref:uncharacterized protein LOC118016226 isoform X1 n=1 Tax=Mirounga leonina TaxID=9715 RepID=UPI00156BFE7A|nr:uncharacterized protein LOC118016226 isoform X1 [Mirounga leonina]
MPREAGRRQVRTREGAVGRPDVTGTRRLPAPTGFPPTPPPAVPRYPCACIPLSSVASRARVYPGQHGRRSARRASTGGRRQLDVLALSGSGSYSLTRTRSPHDPRVGRRYGSHSDRSQVSVRCSPLPSGLCGGSGSGGAAWPPGQWLRTPDPRALTVSRHVQPFHSSVGGGLPPLLPGSWPPGPGAPGPSPTGTTKPLLLSPTPLLSHSPSCHPGREFVLTLAGKVVHEDNVQLTAFCLLSPVFGGSHRHL